MLYIFVFLFLSLSLFLFVSFFLAIESLVGNSVHKLYLERAGEEKG